MAKRWGTDTLWSKLEVEELIRLRAEGLGPAEIARRLQRTENSVNSKIRQLRLPNMVTRPPMPHERPERERAQPEPVQRAGRVTLDPLPSLKGLQEE